MNEKPDRVAIWKQKYRDSEAARVKAVRRAEASEFNFGQNVKELRTAEAEIKKLKKDPKCHRCELGLEGFGWICPKCHDELTGFWAVAEKEIKRLKKEATS